MKIYLKILTLGLFSSLLFGANLPNIWTTGFGQGWLEYNISNEKEQFLIISCNVGYDDETDHNIVFSTSSKEFSGEDLAFVMDGNAYYPLSMPTNTRNGANMWYEFSTNIANAQKIEVYRVYKVLGLNIKRRTKKRIPARIKQPLQYLSAPNEQWAMDFMSDTLYGGRRYRIWVTTRTAGFF